MAMNIQQQQISSYRQKQPPRLNPNLYQMSLIPSDFKPPLHTQQQPQPQVLSKITQTPQQYEQSTQQNFPNGDKTCCNKNDIKNYLSSWGLFLIAYIVYLLIWVVGHFSIQRLTSYYYFNDFNVSPYSNIDYWRVTNRATNIQGQQTYIQSNSLYPQDELKTADAITLSLVFSWLMWKLPLVVFVLFIPKGKPHLKILQYTIWAFYLIILLLIDIMVTIFKPEDYQDWVFFIIYFVLSLILVIANSLMTKNKNKPKIITQTLKDYLLPICYIVLAYACYSILIPGIYHAIYNGIEQDAAYIIVHIFPVIDLISYSLIPMITYFTSHHTVKFVKMLHFLNTGYAVGHVILFSPEDVEFYYLCTYFVIRNFSFNWIVKKVQKYVIIPSPTPGWIMIYLISLCINFIPFTGIGKLVVSKSFYSQILQLTLPIQAYHPPNDYYAYYSSNLPSISTFNPSLQTNIQISTVFIIWALLTITQKYHISKFQYKEIFYYIFGIYLFYFGLTTGTQLYYLQANSL